MDISFNTIKTDNYDEFIIWLWETKYDRNSKIPDDVFENLIYSENWSDKNFTWEYAYTAIQDSYIDQQKMMEEMAERKKKPERLEDKRELFARKALERLKKSNKGYEKTKR